MAQINILMYFIINIIKIKFVVNNAKIYLVETS